MRDFTVSEMWGPFKCEVAGCQDSEAFTVRLTDDENSTLPEKTGSKAVTYIFRNKLGVAMCERCRKLINAG